MLAESKRIKREIKDPGDKLTIDWAMKVLRSATEAQPARRGEQKDVAELERMFGLDDPRG